MTSDRSVSLHVPRVALWLLGFLLLAPWLLFGVWVLARHAGLNQTTAAKPALAATQNGSATTTPVTDVVKASAGVWGTVEYFRILIEPPEEFVRTDSADGTLPTWIFKGYSEAKLASFLQSLGLEPEQLRYLMDPTHREVRSDAIVIRPDRDLIVGLKPEVRAKLYTALGDFSENFAQYNPYRLRATSATSWFDQTDLPAEVVALTKQLFYPRGTALCFSDEAIVLPTIADPGQRVQFVKTMSRKSALMVQLRIAHGENIDALAEYWGRGGRSKDLKPFLQSIARRPMGGEVDIVHLLPRFARLLLYTYPLPSEKASDSNHDCHWTSFNFQNELPDERFSSIDFVRQTLLDDYYPVPGNPLLGDIIMFVRPDGVVVHSCVYIADNIVFTKNGPGFSVPWLLATLSDVQAFYSATPGIELRRFRPKRS